jgi:fructose/tagatose bisphosphate aldolase
MAQAVGVSVEGELGCLGSLEIGEAGEEAASAPRASARASSQTYGVPVEAIVEGIRHGVRKVNIDTDIRLAMTGAMRRAMARDPAEFHPRKFFKDATAAARGFRARRVSLIIAPFPAHDTRFRFESGPRQRTSRARDGRSPGGELGASGHADGHGGNRGGAVAPQPLA